MRLRKLCFCVADPRDGEDKRVRSRNKPRRPKAGRGGTSRGLAVTAPNEQGSDGHGSNTHDGSAAALMVAAAYASSTLVSIEGGSSHGLGGDDGGGDGGG
ncbi:uncharacterized protein J3R85_010898 [Psidium guajava]|nr:uncharacterized protein J3R85_010898 [Psidium guajava]